MKPRLIEVDFPLRQVSEASVREKNIRHGHISTLHIWWARRPLAASRATALAALVEDDPARREELLSLIKQLAPWESAHDERLLERARALIRATYGGRAPRILDPFAGGGSIPLEALRLGCEAYALDYNPVAVLLNKAVLEYPQRYGQAVRVKAPSHLMGYREVNPLLEAVKRWGEWVLCEARRELERFYPPDPDGSIPVGYIWARTLPCQNPACGAEIPLMHQFWLAKKAGKRIALRPIPNRAARRVEFQIVRGEAMDFDPEEGTVSRANVRCPLCGGAIDANTTRRLFREGKAGQRLVAVVLAPSPALRRGQGRAVEEEGGKAYRLATARDLEAYRAAEAALGAKRQALRAAWGLDPVPDERIPTPCHDVDRPPMYGMPAWGDLFNARQKLALITFADAVRRAHARMLEEGAEGEFAKAVATYLALFMSRMVDYMSNLCLHDNVQERVVHVFGRQALPMVWDYSELNPLSEAVGSWVSMCERRGLAVLERLASANMRPGMVSHGSATALPWPDDAFDAILTDPPYYDNVRYSYLSDFFYVWLKRTVGDLYPDLLATPLTPKAQEIVAYTQEGGGMEEAKRRFEAQFTVACREMARVLKPEGIAVIVFAHKTTAAWEAAITALLEAGLYLTASWPIHTEMQARLNAQETAALASSIYMVCRKRVAQEVGEYGPVREAVARRVRERLAQFWEEGIRGGDFFMSAIGPAVEAFGRYARVEKLSGEVVSVAEWLEYVHRLVAEFALERVLQSPDLGGVDQDTRFYLLWRWTYNHARVPFDEANKLARAVGAEISDLWSRGGFVQKDQEYVRALGPRERLRDGRFFERERYDTLVDALHKACLLWERGERQALSAHLALNRGGEDVFWRVAQSIADVLPPGDKEKQLLQGLLNVQENVLPSGPRQGKLI